MLEANNMNHNDRNDLAAMLSNKQALSQLAKSEDAQALAGLLSRSHDSAELEKLAKGAAGGDIQSLKTLMQTITENPQAKDLLQRLSETFQKN